MHQTTPLSSGNLNGQTLKVELVEPGNDLPNAVAIRWPQKPTITSPATFDKVVADATRCGSCRMRSSPKPWPKHAARTPNRPPDKLRSPNCQLRNYWRKISNLRI